MQRWKRGEWITNSVMDEFRIASLLGVAADSLPWLPGTLNQDEDAH